MTYGPLLTFQVSETGPGVEAYRPGSGSTLSILAAARSHSPFSRLQIFANGEVIAETAAGDEGKAADLQVEVSLPQGGWLAGRCLRGIVLGRRG